MNKLARMSVTERRQMIDDFRTDVFGGLIRSPAGPALESLAPRTCPMTPRRSRSRRLGGDRSSW